MPTDTTTKTTASPDGPRTDIETRIWDMLSPQPQTTAQVVAATGAGRSTTGKALARWAKAGVITRHDDAPDSRTATWSRDPEPAPDEPNPYTDTAEKDCTPTSAVPDAPPQGAGADEAAGHEPGAVSPAPVVGLKPERLKPGGLFGLVEDHLRAHPGEEFGPSQIGKALNRSSGAVNNALEKMATGGVAVKTQAAPKRFALAPGEEN